MRTRCGKPLHAVRSDWVKAFLIEALIEQSVSEEFTVET